MLAAPARPAGSMAAPARKVSWAVTRGRLVLRATITRRPLGRVRSTGRGRMAVRGAATGGGRLRPAGGAPARTQRRCTHMHVEQDKTPGHALQPALALGAMAAGARGRVVGRAGGGEWPRAPMEWDKKVEKINRNARRAIDE